MILVDWDDTLFPSSWFSALQISLKQSDELSSEQSNLLMAVEYSIVGLLSNLARLGQVVIVTNASKEWVVEGCSRLMPIVKEHLSRVRVCSARDSFATVHPESPAMWKREAFSEAIDQYMESRESFPICHVLSIGDSNDERRALHMVRRRMKNVLAKSIKMVERPSIQVLLQSHAMLKERVKDVLSYPTAIDFEICPRST